MGVCYLLAQCQADSLDNPKLLEECEREQGIRRMYPEIPRDDLDITQICLQFLADVTC